MFINCPHCSALVATDPATDLPPARCPRCASVLRETHAAPDVATTRPEAVADASPAAGATPVRESGASRETDAARTDEADPARVVAPGMGRDADALAFDGTEVSAILSETAPAVDPAATEAEDAASARQLERTAATADGTENEASAQAPVEDSPQPPGPTADTVIHDADKASTAADEADASAVEGAETGIDAMSPAQTAQAGESSSPPASSAAIAPSRRDKSAPSFVRTRAPAVAANARRRWALPSLIAGLSLLLALQWILADRARLAADAGWRPFVAQLCATLRCDLPPWREPSAFALLERDVRPHPDVPGALRVTATFRNDARWPQPWPEVVLTLSDVDGRAIGVRAFDASDYLGTAPTQNALSSGQTATIRMDVVEPAPRSVAFAFDFR